MPNGNGNGWRVRPATLLGIGAAAVAVIGPIITVIVLFGSLTERVDRNRRDIADRMFEIRMVPALAAQIESLKQDNQDIRAEIRALRGEAIQRRRQIEQGVGNDTQ